MFTCLSTPVLECCDVHQSSRPGSVPNLFILPGSKWWWDTCPWPCMPGQGRDDGWPTCQAYVACILATLHGPHSFPNLELHNAMDECFQFQNWWQNWKSTHWVSNLHFTTGPGEGDNNIWERGKEFETTCKAGLAVSRTLIHRWVSACLADTTCILSHKGLTHSLLLFCWTSFFHYHFLELALWPITPFEAGFKCQPTFCCAHSFYNLHVWKTVFEFWATQGPTVFISTSLSLSPATYLITSSSIIFLLQDLSPTIRPPLQRIP